MATENTTPTIASSRRVSRCFIDLDGVLADFHTTAAARHGVPFPAPWPPGVWSMAAVLGLDSAVFWAPLDESFWTELQPTVECHALLALCERFFGPENVCILSSPPRDPGSLAGKCRWIVRHLPAYERRFLIGPAKHFCASPAAVLVDDSDTNLACFAAAGGQGVLVARPWNTDHAVPPDEVLADLERKLRRLTGSPP